MKALLEITLQDVKAMMQQKGYKVFDAEGVPNIVGIRNAAYDVNDDYNDRCWVWWMENGVENSHFYSVTTHPGFYYLENPIAGTKGTAILVPGQYLGCWALGMMHGTQLALCQSEGPVQVYRDDNKDDILTCDPATIDTGYFGIDLHHGSVSDNNVIGPYSAGCQVWRFKVAHEQLMAKFSQLSQKNSYKAFSYTLLKQEDFA